MTQMIVFTDLDGTLLDHHTYSFKPAQAAIDALNTHDICWVLNSSKTLAELSVLRSELHHKHPLIVENGAGIAIPEGYNHACWHMLTDELEQGGGFHLHAMGMVREEILSRLQPLKQQFHFEGFADMSVAKLMTLTGLDESRAIAAKDRHFSEPLCWQDGEDKLSEFTTAVETLGLSLLRGGRFVHVMGSADKGRAMKWLLQGYTSVNHQVVTVALGDSQNDLAMLSEADIAVVVRSPVHAPPELKDTNAEIRLTDDFGPKGWNSAVLKILEENNYD